MLAYIFSVFLAARTAPRQSLLAMNSEKSVTSRTRRSWNALTNPRNQKSNYEEILVIDGDNVRGKSGWAWNAADLASEVARWSDQKTILFLDHGEMRQAFSLTPECSLAFAGPESTADDAIVDAVDWLLGSTSLSVAVVTSDYGLRARLSALGARAKRGTGASRMRHVHSQRVIDVLSSSQAEDKEAPSYVDDFMQTYESLDQYLTQRQPVRKKRRGARSDPGAGSLSCEKTWMRVLLAERLRLVAQDQNLAADAGLLSDFAEAFTRDEDSPRNSSSLLSHRFSDRRQRRDLVAFANSLLDDVKKESDVEISKEDPRQDEELPLTPKLIPVLHAKRRRRARRKAELIVSRPTNVGALLEHRRDDLENAIAEWILRPN